MIKIKNKFKNKLIIFIKKEKNQEKKKFMKQLINYSIFYLQLMSVIHIYFFYFI